MERPYPAIIIAAMISLTSCLSFAAEQNKKTGVSQSPQYNSGNIQYLPKITNLGLIVRAPDLKPILSGPARAKTGTTLGIVNVTVHNKGRGNAKKYSGSLYLKSGSRKTKLRSFSGLSSIVLQFEHLYLTTKTPCPFVNLSAFRQYYRKPYMV